MLLTTLLDGVLCAPWLGESFGSQVVANRCVKVDAWAVLQGVAEVLLDAYIFILPLPIISKLQVDARRKIGVSLIFMTASM